MIIRKLHIENFGHFHDFTLEFSPGLNRLCRENEFGKTTIFEFVRRVLWGYPDGRKSQLNRYPARFNDGAYGGFLEVVLADGSEAILERYGEKGKLVVRRPDGGEEDGEEFLRRLTPVSADCYRNIYAVTLDELTVLSSLDGDEIRGRLYGGAITGGGVSLPKLGKFLDDRARELYKQRGSAFRIGEARQQLRAACDKRDAAVTECARRPALEKELEELERETSRLRAEAAECARAVAETDLLLKAHPRYLKLAEVEAAIAALPTVGDVPEAAARRADELTKRLAEFERALPPAPDAPKLAVLAAEAALLDRELAAAGGKVPLPEPEDLLDAELLSGKCAALTPPAAAPAAWVWLATLLAPVAVVAAAFVADIRFPAFAAAFVAAGAAVVGWVVHLRRRADRLRLAAETERELDEFRERLGVDCPPEKFVSVLRARLRRRELARELEGAHEAQAAHDRAASVKRELEELCRRFGCSDAAEMSRMAKLGAQANDLRRRRAETASALDALLPQEKQAALVHFDPEAAAKLRDEAAAKGAELEKSILSLHQKSGAVANELKHLPDGGEIELANSEIEAAKSALRRFVREYLVVRTCRKFLDAAVDRYERESQPEVFKHAEKLFSDFTGGRYTRLYKKLATGELTVCDGATGQEKTFPILSRGSREELMLAMRLALIECTERGTEPLPVCFDDVGVNFDPARLARAEAAVEAFAEDRQVIWFSHS